MSWLRALWRHIPLMLARASGLGLGVALALMDIFTGGDAPDFADLLARTIHLAAGLFS